MADVLWGRREEDVERENGGGQGLAGLLLWPKDLKKESQGGWLPKER